MPRSVVLALVAWCSKVLAVSVPMLHFDARLFMLNPIS